MPDADAFDRNPIAELELKAEEVGRALGALANSRRLLALCHLMQQGEASVTQLTEATGLSQSALSQHLAMMRGEGLVRARRSGLNVFYSIADARVAALMHELERIYCAHETTFEPDGKRRGGD